MNKTPELVLEPLFMLMLCVYVRIPYFWDW